MIVIVPLIESDELVQVAHGIAEVIPHEILWMFFSNFAKRDRG